MIRLCNETGHGCQSMRRRRAKGHISNPFLCIDIALQTDKRGELLHQFRWNVAIEMHVLGERVKS